MAGKNIIQYPRIKNIYHVCLFSFAKKKILSNMCNYVWKFIFRQLIIWPSSMFLQEELFAAICTQLHSYSALPDMISLRISPSSWNIFIVWNDFTVKCKKIYTPKSFGNRLCYCRSEMCMKNTFKVYIIKLIWRLRWRLYD